jgi:hypothetical protein
VDRVRHQNVPSRIAASKLAAIARTTARSLELVTLHLHSLPHVFDKLGHWRDSLAA